jgi:hypothetical protein
MNLKDLAAKLEETKVELTEDVPAQGDLSFTEDAFDAPMMIMNQIHEA